VDLYGLGRNDVDQVQGRQSRFVKDIGDLSGPVRRGMDVELAACASSSVELRN